MSSNMHQYLNYLCKFVLFLSGFVLLTGFKPLSVGVVSRYFLPDWIKGDTEMIEARLGENYLGLMTYVQDRNGEICRRNGQIKQNVFVSPLDPYTGLPFEPNQAKQVGSDECGNPKMSDAEFGLDQDGRPLLAYTSDAGVQLVSFQGDDWSNAVVANQWIPGSEKWQIAAKPLSEKFPELQIKVSQAGNVLWSRILIDSTEGGISDVIKIYDFHDWLPKEDHTSMRSRLHPTDPTRFIRVSKSGIYEFSDTGIDLEVIYNRSWQPFHLDTEPLLWAWMMPANECIDLGLQPPSLSAQNLCLAVVFSEYISRLKTSFLIVKAKDFNEHWVDILKIPYKNQPPHKNQPPRVNVAVINHLKFPRSAIFATGDGDARLYFLDGSVFLVDSEVKRSGSEMLYFSESQLLGLYYKDASTNRKLVSMIRVE